jgi:hypothetical protein
MSELSQKIFAYWCLDSRPPLDERAKMGKKVVSVMGSIILVLIVLWCYYGN